ncbi:MAG: hypothetical protein R3F62_16845 [Planctomycetota bacterium]
MPRLPQRAAHAALCLTLLLVGCSELVDVRTRSGRTSFAVGETVVIQVFEDGRPVTDATLQGLRLRWSVHNLDQGGGYVELGYHAQLVTDALAPGRNLVAVEVENDPGYRLPPTGGDITITITGPTPPPATPSFAPDAAPSASASGAPASAPAPASPDPAPAPAAPSAGLSGSLGGM